MNTLHTAPVKELLEALHIDAEANYKARYEVLNSISDKEEREKKHDELRKTAYMSVSPEEGSLLYFLATFSKVKNIVEFGCSFGVSTIYLAAAAKDNQGFVITTELEANKIEQAQKNIEKAGLSEYVTFLQGDAMQTLADVDTGIDFLFLDGAKELYLPVFNLLKSKLNDNAIVFADNIDKAETNDFVELISGLNAEFVTTKTFNDQVLIAHYKK
ncbi:O-methyltransferase [Sphingobacterium siyangense]|uniref:Putative O-methyltransferase YrrM n=1 Tax=Sphingobacterium siyangense TaxID=459529 RepID=A0A562MFZ9_9SPHI|nr:class I SAM-dependent methyltransferase [Sphingobacterium siyangense]TWI18843.1 putative O-methyltransferase YrrM [Sphingobacterium siyangense]